jgi:hypothetical protein
MERNGRAAIPFFGELFSVLNIISFHFFLDKKVEQKVKASINRSANLAGHRHWNTPIVFTVHRS